MSGNTDTVWRAFLRTIDNYRLGICHLSKKIWRSESALSKYNDENITNLSLEKTLRICEITRDPSILIAALESLEFESADGITNKEQPPRIPKEKLQKFADEAGYVLVSKEKHGVRGGIKSAAKLERYLEEAITTYTEFRNSLKKKGRIDTEQIGRTLIATENARKALKQAGQAIVSAQRDVLERGIGQYDLFADGELSDD